LVILFKISIIAIDVALIVTNIYDVNPGGASLIVRNDSFEYTDRCMNALKSLDNLGLLFYRVNKSCHALSYNQN